MNTMLETAQVAELSHVTYEHFYWLLKRRIIPRPAHKVGPSYLWTEGEAAAARQIIAERQARGLSLCPRKTML